MGHTTADKWSKEVTGRRESDPYRSALSMLTFDLDRAGAQLQPDEKKRLDEAKDQLGKLYERPASGRNTAVGRRVEKPGEGKPGGPSGQKDGARHDGKHTNR